MPHHLVIETNREVDGAELCELMPIRLFGGVVIESAYVDRDAAAAERAIAKRDRAIRLLVEELGYATDVGGPQAVVAALADPDVELGFPADVVDTIRHVCGIDATDDVCPACANLEET